MAAVWCTLYSPILRFRRSQILGFRSLDYQIQEDTRLAILLAKYRSLSCLDYTPLGAQKSCSMYSYISETEDRRYLKFGEVSLPICESFFFFFEREKIEQNNFLPECLLKFLTS